MGVSLSVTCLGPEIMDEPIERSLDAFRIVRKCPESLRRPSCVFIGLSIQVHRSPDGYLVRGEAFWWVLDLFDGSHISNFPRQPVCFTAYNPMQSAACITSVSMLESSSFSRQMSTWSQPCRIAVRSRPGQWKDTFFSVEEVTKRGSTCCLEVYEKGR